MQKARARAADVDATPDTRLHPDQATGLVLARGSQRKHDDARTHLGALADDGRGAFAYTYTTYTYYIREKRADNACFVYIILNLNAYYLILLSKTLIHH